MGRQRRVRLSPLSPLLWWLAELSWDPASKWAGGHSLLLPWGHGLCLLLPQRRARNFQILPKSCSDISCIGNIHKGLKTRFSAFSTLSQRGQIIHGHGCLQHFYSPIFPSVICIDLYWYLLSFWIPEWFIKALLKTPTFGGKIILGQNLDTAEPQDGLFSLMAIEHILLKAILMKCAGTSFLQWPWHCPAERGVIRPEQGEKEAKWLVGKLNKERNSF